MLQVTIDSSLSTRKQKIYQKVQEEESLQQKQSLAPGLVEYKWSKKSKEHSHIPPDLVSSAGNRRVQKLQVHIYAEIGKEVQRAEAQGNFQFY